jgi:CRP/FNR family transcriptional regulator, cyclic AMP receptor protein
MKSAELANEAKVRLKTQLLDFQIPPTFIEDAVDHHTRVNYNRGAILFPQGSPADLLFLVVTGLVKVYAPRPDGDRILVKLAGPGDIVGYVNYLDPRGRHAQVFEVQALTKCSVALFTRDHALKLLRSLDQASLLGLIERLNTAWSSMAKWFGTFICMSFRERLEVIFRELGARFGVSDTRGTLLIPELSHADFADMIGSSRPMVSRLITDMTKERLLSRQGKQFVLHGMLATGKTEKSDAAKIDGSRVSTKSRTSVESTGGSVAILSSVAKPAGASAPSSS